MTRVQTTLCNAVQIPQSICYASVIVTKLVGAAPRDLSETTACSYPRACPPLCSVLLASASAMGICVSSSRSSNATLCGDELDELETELDQRPLSSINVRPLSGSSSTTKEVLKPKQHKMLLLGTGDSGKTTLLKQMRLLFGVPFSEREVELTRQIIFDNVVHGLRLLLRVMEDMALSVAPVNAECVDILAGVQDLKDYEPFPAWCYEPLKRLWEDPSVREARRRGGEVAVPDYLGYWFSDLERLFDPTYNPTYEDVLHAYTCTTGKAEMGFKLGKRHDVLLVDLGGQRSERKKWVHCFDGMSSVMFVVNLSSYDQPLVEATYVNQMEDALLLWKAIYQSKWFSNTTIFLLFNKVDLFEEKIQYSHIKDYFSDYDGKVGDADAGKQYFLKKFMDAVHKDGEKGPVVRYFFVTATDTKMLRLVLGTVEGLVFHYE